MERKKQGKGEGIIPSMEIKCLPSIIKRKKEDKDES